jgi:hypothetical protein
VLYLFTTRVSYGSKNTTRVYIMETLGRDDLLALKRMTYTSQIQKNLILLTNRLIGDLKETAMTKPAYVQHEFVSKPDYVEMDLFLQHLKIVFKGFYITVGPGEQMVKISW